MGPPSVFTVSRIGNGGTSFLDCVEPPTHVSSVVMSTSVTGGGHTVVTTVSTTNRHKEVFGRNGVGTQVSSSPGGELTSSSQNGHSSTHPSTQGLVLRADVGGRTDV